MFYGRWRFSDEYSGDGNGSRAEAPVIICLFNNYYLGMVRQMQQLFYGKRYEATLHAQKENLSGELQGTECILSAVHTGFYRIGKELRRTRDPCGKRGGHPGGT